MTGFQTQVGINPAPAVAGDFCDTNPRFFVDAGAGGLVAGASGVLVGRACWLSSSLLDSDNAPAVVNSFGSGPIAGFVHRDQQSYITQYLAESSMTILAGLQMYVMSGGGIWVKNDGATAALYQQKAYANFADGKITFAAAGAPTVGASATGSIAASTGSCVGSISGNILTATGSIVGVLVPGGTLSGTNVATGTKIVSQLSGTAGGIGTYSVNIGEQSVAAGTAISETYGTFTAASGLTGTFAIGQTLTGSGISATTTVTALGTGTGGLGTYIVDVNTVVSSTTISAAANVETKFVAMSSGAAGELVKISSNLLG